MTAGKRVNVSSELLESLRAGADILTGERGPARTELPRWWPTSVPSTGASASVWRGSRPGSGSIWLPYANGSKGGAVRHRSSGRRPR